MNENRQARYRGLKTNKQVRFGGKCVLHDIFALPLSPWLILLFCDAVDGNKCTVLHHLIPLCLLVSVENITITVFS